MQGAHCGDGVICKTGAARGVMDGWVAEEKAASGRVMTWGAIA